VKNWRVYVTEVMKGRRRGKAANVLKVGLRCLSWGYRSMVACRHIGYSTGCLKQHSIKKPSWVISVGNIVAGGSGKTPVTLLLAKSLQKQGLSVAVISRGYHSPAESLAQPIILSTGAGPKYGASYCGDEPYLLASNLPKGLVIVGADRVAGAQQAAELGAEAIILDDGMQHRRLARDIEITVIDAHNPLGGGFFLPRGFLRDHPKALSRANLLVIHAVENDKHFHVVRKTLSPYTQVPAIGTRIELGGVWNLEGKPVDLANKRLGVFAGIAHPERFKQLVESLGATVVAFKSFRDHHRFTQQDLVAFSEHCLAEGADLIVCTEKDKVKIDPFSWLALPCAWVQIQLKIVAENHVWEEFIAGIQKK
jgi:tetraacyldisaccharide 4'-kinase